MVMKAAKNASKNNRRGVLQQKLIPLAGIKNCSCVNPYNGFAKY